MKIEYNKDLTHLNTFGMKVSCACYVEYSTEEELAGLFSEDMSLPQPMLHMGGGSNLLFTGDFPGTVLHSAVSFISVSDSSGHEDAGTGVYVDVGAGVRWDDFCAWSAEHGLWGAENLSAIPGEAGAAAVQNIGAYGAEVKDLVVSVRCLDTVTCTWKVLTNAECRYGYRDSIFKDTAKGRYIVYSVLFRLSSEPQPRLGYGHLRSALADALSGQYGTGPDALENALAADPSGVLGMIRKTVMEIRASKLPDPAVAGNAGSFFKNPVVPKSLYDRVASYAAYRYGKDYAVPHYDAGSGFVKIPAAWLIEQCGWKGFSDGNAGVYEKQPLVIVNLTGEASPEEITALEGRIVRSVEDKFGIVLVPEVEHVPYKIH